MRQHSGLKMLGTDHSTTSQKKRPHPSYVLLHKEVILRRELWSTYVLHKNWKALTVPS